MPLDQSFVGRTYPPTAPYEVGREKIREFADAIGDPHPAYRDPASAAALGYPDVIAPPTFAIVMSMPAADVVVRDPSLGLDWSRVVHGDQRFEHRRPLRAGDRIQCVVTVESVKTLAGNDLIKLVTELNTVAGETVCTAHALLVARREAGFTARGAEESRRVPAAGTDAVVEPGASIAPAGSVAASGAHT